MSRKNKVHDGFKSDCLKGVNPFCRSLLRGRSLYSIITFCGAKSTLAQWEFILDVTFKKKKKKSGGGGGRRGGGGE